MRYLILLTILLSELVLSGQYCSPGTYIQNQYTTDRDSGVYYGSAINYRGDTVDLHMNIYYPTNDTLTRHPLIVWVHGGGFQGGSYLAGTIHQLCDSFAARGYVTATIQYRLGFWREYDAILGLFGEPYAWDINEFPRAVVRATQDVKGAIRYLKGNAAQYQIDTNWVFAGGESAGGFTALHVGYMDETDRPAAADSQVDITHRDLFNNVLFRASRPDLGSVEGTLNQNGTSSRVRGVLNIYGAMLDTLFITDTNDPALHQFYILDDPIVACWGAKAFHQIPGIYFPFSGNTKNPFVYGVCALEERMENLGFNNRHHSTTIHPSDPFGSPPYNAHAIGGASLVRYMQNLAGWLDTLICQECDSTELIQFTDQLSAQAGSNALLTVQASGEALEYEWSFNSQTVGTTDSLWLQNISAGDTGTYQLTITNRCGEILVLTAQVSLQPTGISQASPSFFIGPNPVYNQLSISTSTTDLVHFEIADLQGRISVAGIIDGSGSVDASQLPAGVYFLRLQCGDSRSIIPFVKMER